MANFDTGRFGFSGQAVGYDPLTAPAADFYGRLAPSDPVAQGLPGLQRDLLDQQLNSGILPNTPPPTDTERYRSQIGISGLYGMEPPKTTAPAYMDPSVTRSPATSAIYEVSPSTPTAQSQTGTIPGIRSPAEYEQIASTRAALGVPADLSGLSSLSSSAARQMEKAMNARTTFGTLGGALLGGALLGPVGGLLGGYFGRSIGQSSYFPDAPEPVAGQQAKGYDKGDLSDYGQNAYENSSQFAGAVDSGKGGLW